MLALHIFTRSGWTLYGWVEDCLCHSRPLRRLMTLNGAEYLKLHVSLGFFAHFISEVGIFPCSGARDPELNDKLNEVFKRGDWKSVQSLRREPHQPTDTCWLHSKSFCLSKLRNNRCAECRNENRPRPR